MESYPIHELDRIIKKVKVSKVKLDPKLNRNKKKTDY